MRATCLAAAMLTWVVLAGCITNRDSNTARTPEEQMLLSKASDLSIARLDLAKAASHKVFLDGSSLECVDKAYVLDALRQAFATSRATVVEKADDADMVVTVRAAVLATQAGASLFGMPALKLPSPITAGTFETPELAIFKRSRQEAYAKFCLCGYDRDSKDLVFAGEGLARTRFSRWTLLVLLHFSTTNVPELKTHVTRTSR